MKNKSINIKKIFAFTFLLLLLQMPIFFNDRTRAKAVEVPLSWSAKTHTPSRYPGKALPSPNSLVTVTAHIDNTKDLTFKWYLNDEFQKTASGKNKPQFTLVTGDLVGQREYIKLEIEDQNGKIINNSNGLSIPIVNPEVVINCDNKGPTFKNNQIFYNLFPNQQATFRAETYFFNVQNRNRLLYRWRLEEQDAKKLSKEKPFLLNLNIGEINRTIEQALEVEVKGSNQKTQEANNQVILKLTPNND